MIVSPLAAFSGSGAAAAQVNYRKAIILAREALWRDIDSGAAGSASVAIMDNGKIVYSEAFGMADREKGKPVDRDTLFNIGSVSKEFCAVAIMSLVDEGKVSLDARVVRYLPEFTMADPRYKDITVRMLLNHSSGIPGTNWANGMGFALDADYQAETLDSLSRLHLKFAPGEFSTYCNDGFTLAELVVERVSGKDFIDFVSERILKPLSLEDTGLSIGLWKEKPGAAYYDPSSGKKEPSEVVSILAAGGLASTAEDLCRFAYMFSGDGKQILTGASLAEMRKAQPSVEKRDFGAPGWPFGLGWDLTELAPFEENGIRVLGKGGNTGCYTTQILVAPDRKLSVAIVEAGAFLPATYTAIKILEASLVEKGAMPDRQAAPPEPQLSPATPSEPQPIPPEYADFNGYYAASGAIMKMGFDFTKNLLETTLIYQGVEIPRPAYTYHEGVFQGNGGDPIRLIKAHGKPYVVTNSVFGPEIGGQRLEALDKPVRLATDIDKKLWLRRNSGPFEGRSMALFNPFVISRAIPALPGYIDFDGIKKVQSSTTAITAANYSRDQTELSLVDKGGQTWALLSYKLMSPAEVTPSLKRGDMSLTIGVEGYNEWLIAGEDLNLSCGKPERGRVIVFSPQLSPLYDSAIENGKVRVGAGSLIEVTGMPGNVFALKAESPPLWSLDDTLNTFEMPDVDVSPDGKKVAYTVSRTVMTDTQSASLIQIYCADINGENTVQLTKADGYCYGAQWSPDGKQIAFMSVQSGKNEIWLVPAAGGAAVQLTHVATGVYMYRWSRDGTFISYLAPDLPAQEKKGALVRTGDAIVVDENDPMVHIWTVSTQGNPSGQHEAHQITHGDFSVSSWDWSPDGAYLTFARQAHLLPLYEYPTTISRLEMGSGIITDLVPLVERSNYSSIKYSPDGNWIAYSTSHAFFNLMDVSVLPSSGGQSRILAKDQDQSLLLNSLGLLGWSPDGKYLYLSNVRGTKVAITALPADGGTARDILTRGYIAGGRMNSSQSMLGLVMEDFSTPQEVYAAALSGNGDLDPRRASKLNKNVPREKAWESEVLRWTAPDGLTIEGVLTYPAGGEPGKKYPLVVEIHGGPAASFFQYYPGGRTWLISPAGALASQGFALLRPNIRGSNGYGADFVKANFGDWGGKDFQDIVSGVDFLIAQGRVDPDRVAIMGQSFGGYMAAWAVTQTDRFASSVMISGMSNLVSDAGTLDILHYLPDYFGAYFWDDAELYLSRSPIMHVRNVSTPTLILHGQLDPRVPLGQAQEFYNALKLRKVQTKMVVYPRAGHYPGEPKQQRDMWEREIEWFKRYFPAK
ncbi:MAG: serine hydrolase [Spirochaetes bacterium]|nr:serine hydrolase [Spirochaetota bacterium]